MATFISHLCKGLKPDKFMIIYSDVIKIATFYLHYRSFIAQIKSQNGNFNSWKWLFNRHYVIVISEYIGIEQNHPSWCKLRYEIAPPIYLAFRGLWHKSDAGIDMSSAIMKDLSGLFTRGKFDEVCLYLTWRTYPNLNCCTLLKPVQLGWW